MSNYIIYRVNTIQYLVGYDESGAPLWQSASKDDKPVIKFTDLSAVELECKRLQDKNFAVDWQRENERLRYDW